MPARTAERRASIVRTGRGIAPGLVVLTALLLAGCQSPTSSTATIAANDHRLRHPIIVGEGTKTLDLPIGSGTRKLSPQLSAVITGFAQDARARGGGAVEIVAPSGSRNEAAVHAVLPEIRKAVTRGGVASGRIVTRSYRVNDATVAAPIRLAYTGIQAKAGPCGRWPDGINFAASGTRHDPELNNSQYHEFGCSTQSNLAAMVDNPTDLLTPRAAASGDRIRRATVFEKYRAGEQTAGEYKEGDGAQVSDAAGS